MNNKKLLIIFSSVLVLFFIVVSWHQLYSRTTFGSVLEENISSNEEVTSIAIRSRIDEDIADEPLWTRIDDPEIIDELLTEQSNIPLKQQLTKQNRTLEHTMIIEAGANSHYFDFNEDYFVGNGNDYKILDDSFIDTIEKLELEWETSEEFLEVEQ